MDFIYIMMREKKIDFFFDTKKDILWNEYGLACSGSFIMDRRYSGNHNLLSYGEWEHMDVKKVQMDNILLLKIVINMLTILN